MDVLAFVQQQHGPQVANPLVREAGGGTQLQALQLTNTQTDVQLASIAILVFTVHLKESQKKM